MTAVKETEKRTQEQRREETRAALLSSATRLFGERGYRSTSLEDVAEDCGLTIRPIYYHFGNKRGLFSAVNALMEERALQALSRSSAIDAWEAFAELCEDSSFCRILLEDAPNVLGRERWGKAPELPWCQPGPAVYEGPVDDRDSETAMYARVALATLAEAAMVVAEAGHNARVREAAHQLIAVLIPDANTLGNTDQTNEEFS